MAKVKRALISVSDKTGIVEFASALVEMGIEIISTGGTYKTLKEANIKITEISEFTGSPEILDGRVKTLHPKIHGGILGIRDDASHQKQMADNDILPIDLVVVNLYPFEKVYLNENSTQEEIIENIDIGGPTMLRSAAKNYKDVAVVVKAERYEQILKELKENDGSISDELKLTLSGEVFAMTASYDALISQYFRTATDEKFTNPLTLTFEKCADLRYGENPHQSAAFYQEKKRAKTAISAANQLHGKELSFNNIIDLEGALDVIKEFDEPACAIIKHTNPCGAAIAENIFEAYTKALACDPVSAFGSIISFNRPVDKTTAEALSKNFVEAVIAPAFDDEAFDILSAKKNIRLMRLDAITKKINEESCFDLKKVSGGLLLQDKNNILLEADSLKTVTKRKPTDKELKDLLFAWKIVKHVKSNAIVYVKDNATIGVGAGQMSRVDSSRIAVNKALCDTHGSVLASDAFFPFRDGIEAAHEAGCTAVIQPGGSIRDEEVIQACDEYNMAMVFTSIRHFKH